MLVSDKARVSNANLCSKDFVLSVALTPDGKWVLSGSKDRGVQFWHPGTGDCHLMLQGHKNSGWYCSDHDHPYGH